jgi:hypothetical protein
MKDGSFELLLDRLPCRPPGVRPRKATAVVKLARLRAGASEHVYTEQLRILEGRRPVDILREMLNHGYRLEVRYVGHRGGVLAHCPVDQGKRRRLGSHGLLEPLECRCLHGPHVRVDPVFRVHPHPRVGLVESEAPHRNPFALESRLGGAPVKPRGAAVPRGADVPLRRCVGELNS